MPMIVLCLRHIARANARVSQARSRLLRAWGVVIGETSSRGSVFPGGAATTYEGSASAGVREFQDITSPYPVSHREILCERNKN